MTRSTGAALPGEAAKPPTSIAAGASAPDPLANVPGASTAVLADAGLLPGLLPCHSSAELDTGTVLGSTGALPDRALLLPGAVQSQADAARLCTSEGQGPSPTECLAQWLLDQATAAVGTCLARLLQCKSADLQAAVPDDEAGRHGLGSAGRQVRMSLQQTLATPISFSL